MVSKCSLFSFFGDLSPSKKEHSDMGLSNRQPMSRCGLVFQTLGGPPVPDAWSCYVRYFRRIPHGRICSDISDSEKRGECCIMMSLITRASLCQPLGIKVNRWSSRTEPQTACLCEWHNKHVRFIEPSLLGLQLSFLRCIWAELFHTDYNSSQHTSQWFLVHSVKN